MAIRKEARFLFDHLFQSVQARGRLMIFGRPTLMWEGAPSPEEFFRGYGFDGVDTLDVSAYQGASHIHDLNVPEPPAELVGRYAMVMTDGTIEHVFCLPNGLKTAAALVEEGGWLVCGGPMNNWIDHGFYQISPTLTFDYFSENGFEFGPSMALFSFGKDAETVSRGVPLYPGEAHGLNNVPARMIHRAVVRRVAGSTLDRIPQQGLYLDKHAGSARQYRFQVSEPYELRHGVFTAPSTQRFALTNFRDMGGWYAAAFREEGYLPSVPRRPFRSRALVCEDGKPLPWIVSEIAMVKERPGSFFHAAQFIHFTTSDGTDPRENSRKYEVSFPDFKDFFRPPARATQ